MDYLAGMKMKASYQERWGINNLMYITKIPSPVAASEVLLRFNEENQHPELVKQDVLILTGAEDHFIPLKMHYMQVRCAEECPVTDSEDLHAGRAGAEPLPDREHRALP